jgi:hypothetical protein
MAVAAFVMPNRPAERFFQTVEVRESGLEELASACTVKLALGVLHLSQASKQSPTRVVARSPASAQLSAAFLGA